MASRKFVDVPPQEILDNIFEQYHQSFETEMAKTKTLLEAMRIYDAGKNLELAFKNALSSLLPEYVGITRGIVFDTNCEKHSNEIDLIFYDKRYFSGFPINEVGSDTLSYISIDVVLGVASVKRTLSFETWTDSISNLESVYSLNRTPKPNRFHYDMGLGSSLRYKDGSSSTEKIFSCIFAEKCEFCYHGGDNTKVKSDAEIRICIISRFNNNKYEHLKKEMPIDLIYSIDGILAYMIKSPSHGQRPCKAFTLDHLGENKESIWTTESFDFTKPYYCFDNRLARPNSAFGLVITYLSFWCSQLVKSSPNITKIMDNYLTSSFI